MAQFKALGNAPTQDWPIWNPDGSIKSSWLAWFTGVTSVAQGSTPITVCKQSAAQALIPTLPAGSFIFVSDYSHWLYWDGKTSIFADDGSDYYALGQRASGSSGWHLVDGTADVTYLNADGSVSTRSLLNVEAIKAYLAGVNGPDSLNAPTAPTINTPADTGDSITGASIPANTVPAVTGITIPATTGNDSDGGITFLPAGAGSTAAVNPHTHPMGAVTDPGHKHGMGLLADPGHHHTIGAVTADTDGQPRNFTSKLWYRQ